MEKLQDTISGGYQNYVLGSAIGHFPPVSVPYDWATKAARILAQRQPTL